MEQAATMIGTGTSNAADSSALKRAVAGDSARDWEAELEELLRLTSLLPCAVRALVESHPQMPDLLEVRNEWSLVVDCSNAAACLNVYLNLQVVMDLGRPPLARFPDGDVLLSEKVCPC